MFKKIKDGLGSFLDRVLFWVLGVSDGQIERKKWELKNKSNQPKLEKFCPRCVGKGFVDESDIKRLGTERKWNSGKCGFCKGTGYVDRSDTREPTLGTTASSEW
jgi:RecJ-like exonuclease